MAERVTFIPAILIDGSAALRVGPTMTGDEFCERLSSVSAEHARFGRRKSWIRCLSAHPRRGATCLMMPITSDASRCSEAANRQLLRSGWVVLVSSPAPSSAQASDLPHMAMLGFGSHDLTIIHAAPRGQKAPSCRQLPTSLVDWERRVVRCCAQGRQF